jgi:hypothetical protein
VALLVAGQFAQSALFVTSFAQAQFNMAAGGFDNLPVRALEAADTTVSRLQRREHAGIVFVLTQLARDASLAYMLVSEHPERVSVPDDCLILPAPSSSPALIVSSRASSDAAQFLSSLHGVQHIAEIPLPGGEPLEVFRVTASVPASPAERDGTPVIFRDGAGNGLELDSVAWSRPGVLRLRWTELASTPSGEARTWYRIAADAHAAGGASQAASTVDCQPTAWQAGEVVYTWLPVPGATGSQPPVISTTPRSGAVAISVQEQTIAPGIHQIGPLQVLSFDELATPMQQLPAVLPSPS